MAHDQEKTKLKYRYTKTDTEQLNANDITLV